jgi:2-amino-4-hydroxy-6-hydroxymethyldihydropteridine diphosphokinase
VPSAFVGLGSNLGDRAHNMRRAVELLRGSVEIAAQSPLYETAPVGYTDQGNFLNAVIEIATEIPAHALLVAMRDAEVALGKATRFENGPRTIDLDLLLYGDSVVETPDLSVPHPRMHERRFVLAPLADIAPDAMHPVLGKTISELLASLPSDGVELSGERWRIPAERQGT